MSMLSLWQYTCDHPATIDFNLSDYMGRWYLQQQTIEPTNGSYKLYSCQTSDFVDADGDSFTLLNAYNYITGSFGVGTGWNEFEGSCTSDGSCTFEQTASFTTSGFTAASTSMSVIATDYSSYAINYACDDSTGFPRVWIFTRS